MRTRTDVTNRPPPQEPLAHLLAARAGLTPFCRRNFIGELFRQKNIVLRLGLQKN